MATDGNNARQQATGAFGLAVIGAVLTGVFFALSWTIATNVAGLWTLGALISGVRLRQQARRS